MARRVYAFVMLATVMLSATISQAAPDESGKFKNLGEGSASCEPVDASSRQRQLWCDGRLAPRVYHRLQPLRPRASGCFQRDRR